MTKISASDVNKLRKQTGAGMMDCKNALTEAQGDFTKAVDVLRKKGQKIATKRGDREATEGCVIAEVSDTQDKATLSLLACETDFVAKNKNFQDFAKQINDIALKSMPNTTEELSNLSFSNTQKVSEEIVNQIGVIGEKLEIKAYEKVQAEFVVAYNHPGNRLATIVGFDKKNEKLEEIGRDIAMQVAAMNPIAIDEEGVPRDILDKELELGKEIARKEGKPEEIIDRIAQGKVGKFIKENTLLNQQFIKDNSKTVAQIIKEAGEGIHVTAFKRVTTGN